MTPGFEKAFQSRTDGRGLQILHSLFSLNNITQASRATCGNSCAGFLFFHQPVLCSSHPEKNEAFLHLLALLNFAASFVGPLRHFCGVGVTRHSLLSARFPAWGDGVLLSSFGFSTPGREQIPAPVEPARGCRWRRICYAVVLCGGCDSAVVTCRARPSVSPQRPALIF